MLMSSRLLELESRPHIEGIFPIRVKLREECHVASRTHAHQTQTPIWSPLKLGWIVSLRGFPQGCSPPCLCSPLIVSLLRGTLSFASSAHQSLCTHRWQRLILERGICIHRASEGRPSEGPSARWGVSPCPTFKTAIGSLGRSYMFTIGTQGRAWLNGPTGKVVHPMTHTCGKRARDVRRTARPG